MYALSKNSTYKPKAEKNIRSWVKIQATLEKGKGKADLKDLHECMNYTEGTEKITHVDFVSYLVRLGHLVETKK